MTQAEVLKVLEKSKRWMTVKEIANIIGNNSGCVSVSSKRLRNRGEIKFKISKKTDKVAVLFASSSLLGA